jgi:hypothetical protein
MKNFLKNPDKLIYLLLVFCAVLYFVGIWYGLPYFFVGDEPSLIGGALKMIQLKNPIPALNPSAFNILYYPPLIPYLLNIFFAPVLGAIYLMGHFTSLAAFQNYLILNPSVLILVARMMSVLFGVGLVFLIYKITKEIIKNSWASLLGATIFGLSFYQFQMSHFARHWIYTAFFAALILYCAIKIYFTSASKNLIQKEEKDSPINAPSYAENNTDRFWLWRIACEKKWYLFAGIAGGLSFGVSYVGIIYLVFVGWIHFFAPLKNISRFSTRRIFSLRVWNPMLRASSLREFTGSESLLNKIKSKNIWYFILVFLILSFIFFIIYPQSFLAVSGGGGASVANKSFGGFLSSILQIAQTLFFMDPVISILGFLGIIYCLYKRKDGYFMYPAIFLIVIYPVLLYFMFHDEPRYVFLLMPIFGVFAAEIIWWIFSFKNVLVKYGIVLGAIIFSLVMNIRYDLLLTRSDTRILAKNWIEQNIPSGSSILVNFSQLHIPQTKESIQDQKVLSSVSLRSYDQAYLNSDLKNQELQYFVLNSRFLAGDQSALYNLKTWYAFDYLAFEHQKSDPLSDFEKQMVSGRFKVQSFYPSLALNGEDFTGNFIGGVWNFFKVQNFGPEVDIYKL